MERYFDKNLVGMPVLQVTFTREVDDEDALYREATLPYVPSKYSLDVECKYAEHLHGISLEMIDYLLMNQTPGAVIKSIGTEYNAIQLASYISAYKLAGEEEECCMESNDYFKYADTDCKRLLAICSIDDLSHVLSKKYAGILVNDVFMYPFEMIREKLDRAYSIMNKHMRKTPVFMMLPKYMTESANYDMYISKLEMYYNYTCIGVKAPNSAYLERLIYDRCLRRDVELEENIDLRRVLEEVEDRMNDKETIEMEIDKLAKRIKESSYFTDEISTDDFLYKRPVMINEYEFRRGINCEEPGEPGYHYANPFDEFCSLDDEPEEEETDENEIEIADEFILNEFIDSMTDETPETEESGIYTFPELDIPEIRVILGEDNEYYTKEGEKIIFEHLNY